MKKNSKKIPEKYLEIAPLGLSLWRSVEAKHLSSTKDVLEYID